VAGQYPGRPAVCWRNGRKATAAGDEGPQTVRIGGNREESNSLMSRPETLCGNIMVRPQLPSRDYLDMWQGETIETDHVGQGPLLRRAGEELNISNRPCLSEPWSCRQGRNSPSGATLLAQTRHKACWRTSWQCRGAVCPRTFRCGGMFGIRPWQRLHGGSGIAKTALSPWPCTKPPPSGKIAARAGPCQGGNAFAGILGGLSSCRPGRFSSSKSDKETVVASIPPQRTLLHAVDARLITVGEPMMIDYAFTGGRTLGMRESGTPKGLRARTPSGHYFSGAAGEARQCFFAGHHIHKIPRRVEIRHLIFRITLPRWGLCTVDIDDA